MDLESTQGASGDVKSTTASEGGAGSFDVDSFLSEHKAHTAKIEGELRNTSESSRRLESKLTKLSKVLSDSQEEGGHDPIQSQIDDCNQEIDRLKELKLRAETLGVGIPETVKIGLEVQQSKIRELKRDLKISEQEKRIAQLSDPDFQRNNDAYKILDAHVANAVDGVYGPGKEYDIEKKNMSATITARLFDQLQNLQKTDPDYWNHIRKQPEALKKLAMAQAERSIPPKALQIMETEKLRNMKMGVGELHDAFMKLKAEPPSRARDKELGELRAQIWSEKFSSKKARYR